MRWWDSATGHLYVQPRLCVHVKHDNSLRGYSGDVCRVWCRLPLRRQWRASSRMFVFGRICLDICHIKCLCHDNVNMFDCQLRRRERVRRRIVAAGRLHMQRRLCFHIHYDSRV